MVSENGATESVLVMVGKHSSEEMIEITLFLLRIDLTFSWWYGDQIILTAGQMYDYFKTPGITDTLIHEVYLHKECRNYVASYAIEGRGNISSFEKDLGVEDPKRWGEVSRLLTWLEIPFEEIRHYPGGIIDNGCVSAYDLYDILMDDKKFKALAYKLKLKAFW